MLEVQRSLVRTLPRAALAGWVLPDRVELGTFSKADGPWTVDWVRAKRDALTALAAIDFSQPEIVVWVPGTDATTNLIGAAVLQAAKPGIVVVNVGRGTVIDEPALIDALRSGQVSSAYLDVFATEPLPIDSPLWSMPTVVIAPHTAALNSAEDRRIAELFADNLRRFLDGQPLRNVMDTKDFY